MSIADRLLNQEGRALSISGAHPRDPVLAQIYGSNGNTAAGTHVNVDKAMQITALYACVRILSSALATLPLELYKRLNPSGREKATEYNLYRKLHSRPNVIQSSFEWRELMGVHLQLRGNGYNFLDYGKSGELDSIIPLHPDRTRAFRVPENKIAYEHINDYGESKVYLQEEILHFRGMSLDGINGIDPIQAHKETLGLSLAADEFGARYFGNSTVIDGVLESEQELGEEAYNRLKNDWKERRQGLVNAHKPILLESGLKWRSLTVEPEKAQFLETRKYQRSDIAMIFGVPPHMIGDTEKSTSFGSGIESQNIGFLIYSLMPWLVRGEQAIDRDLLSEKRYSKLYSKYNVSALMRGDSKSRGEFYKILFSLAAINANEIREYEELNPYDGGDVYYAPLNMGDVSKLENFASDQLNNDSPPTEENKLERLHYRMVEQTAQRIVSCECRTFERIIRSAKSAADIERKASEFCSTHGDFLQRHLQPVAGKMESVITETLLSNLRDQVKSDLAEANPVGALTERVNKWRAGRAEIISRSISLAALEGLKGEL